MCVVHCAPLSRDKRKEKIKINCVDKSLNSSRSISEKSHNSNINDVSNNSDTSIMTERIPELGILSSNESSNEDQNIETNKRSDKNCLPLNCASNTGDLAVNGYPIVGQKFMSAEDIITLLANADDKTTVESIPNGRKENVYFIVSEDKNLLRSNNGKTKRYPDDCGVWNTSRGKVANTHFVVEKDKKMKSLILRNQRYYTRKMISGKTVLEKVEPQQSPEQIMISINVCTKFQTTLEAKYKCRRKNSMVCSTYLVMS